jgi:TRAP-type mannitol/chloroaromatic compound transport system substrate-binding protein
MAENNANNGTYLNKLINEYGVELREFNDDVYDAFGTASAEVNEEARDHSPLAAEIFDSHLKARSEIGAWTALSDAAYVVKRNRVLDM